MNLSVYLQEKQSVLFQTFSRALKEGRLAHAYLLVGENGTPLQQVGEYLAKSILCDSPNPLADEECEACRRIEKGDYPDYRFYDGSEGSIKKDEVQSLIHYFEQTPLESKGIMVYLIHCVEGMTPEAENSLLKFLEEPNPCAYAILTTRNEAKVLPTIVSRCQTLHLKLTPRDEVLEDCKKAGIDEKDAELLSFLANDLAFIQEGVKSKTYQNAKMAFEEIVSSLQKGLPEARFAAENVVIPLLKERPVLKEFLEFLTLFYEDVLAWKYGTPLKLASYGKMSRAVLEKTDDPKKALLSVMNARQEADTNINGGLLLLHMLHQFKEE